MTTQWIYIFGERNGADLKIGRTSNTLRKRLNDVNRDMSPTGETYVLLVAVKGSPIDEAAMRAPFALRAKGTREEYVLPTSEACGYANWLRSQWFATCDLDEDRDEFVAVDSDVWLPGTTGDNRRLPPPEPDDSKLIQDYESILNDLTGTAWSWMVNIRSSIQDYFTPTPIIEAARATMGGIDLDAASHWLANKVHQIPAYFDRNRSAFEYPWKGRVWLNPPYGDNEPWFREIVRYVEAGEVTQMCMLSPVWAFTTKQASEMMAHVTAMLLFVPTPKFWGNANPDKVGSNQPHAIVYIGDEVDAFHEHFARFGHTWNPHR